MRRCSAALFLLCASSDPVYAQIAQPVGVTVQRVGVTVRHAALRSGPNAILDRRTMSEVSDLSDGNRSSIWPWIGIGVLGGAVVGGAVVIAEVARTDDPFMPGVAVGYGVVGGALIGGAIGALLYVVTRSAVTP